MSLNRCEQRLFDYVQSHPEERQFWQGKVRAAVKTERDDFAAVARLEPELRRYHEERTAAVGALREAARLEGPGRTSMKNLAELMIRLWVEPRPKKKITAPDAGMGL